MNSIWKEREESVVTNKFRLADAKDWWKKYKNLRDNASRRKLEMTLSFSQYLRLAKKSGIKRPSQIGRHLQKYQLSRYGDTGGYTNSNCRFITQEENLAEMSENGGIDSMIKKKTGRTKESDPGHARQAMAISGRTAKTHSGVARTTNANSKRFIIRDPVGNIYRGKNLRKFCRDHKLPRSSMNFVLLGSKIDCHGWTGRWKHEIKTE